MSKGVLGVGDYVIVGSMLVISASVGIFFRFTGGRQKTTNEYLMAGKTMGIFPVAFSLMASYMSAISILGIPAEVYMYGAQLLMWNFGMPIGSLIAMYALLPVYFDLNVSTAYEYLEKRYGRTTRTIISLMFILQTVIYMSVVVYAPSVAVNSVTEFSTWDMVLTFVIVATFYCYMGGLKAVLWTDVFQAFLMYIPVSAIVIYAISRHGLVEVYNIAKDRGQLIFFNVTADPTVRYTFWNTATKGIISGIALFGTNQTQLQRLMSVGDLKRGQRALFWSVLLIMAFEFCCVSAGVVMSAIFHECDPLFNPHTYLSSQDQLLPYCILDKFGKIPGLTGLCLAGIISAALSTLSSTLNSLSSVTVEDFIRPYCLCKGLTDAWMSHIAKLLAVGFGASCLLLVFMVANFRGVIEASSIMDSFLWGPMFGVCVLGFFSATANETGVLIGMVTGISISAWISLGSYLAKAPIPTLPRSSEGCLASLNQTFVRNGSSFFETVNKMQLTEKIQNFTHHLPKDERYIFPLYKVSFIWFAITGFTVTIVIGLIASFIARTWTKSWYVDVRCLSPFVRRFHLSAKDASNLQEEVALLNLVDTLEED